MTTAPPVDYFELWMLPCYEKLRAKKIETFGDEEAAFHEFEKTYESFASKQERYKFKTEYEKEQNKLHEQAAAAAAPPTPKPVVVVAAPVENAMAVDVPASTAPQPAEEETKTQTTLDPFVKLKTEDKGGEKKKAATKPPAKRAKKSDSKEEEKEVPHTLEGLYLAAYPLQTKFKLQKEHVAAFLRDPVRASLALAALVSYTMVRTDKKPSRLFAIATEVYLSSEGKLETSPEDMSVLSKRNSRFKEIYEEEKKRLESDDNTKEYHSEAEKKKLIPYEARRAMFCAETKSLPFNRFVTHSFPHSDRWQIAVLPFKTEDGKHVADVIHVNSFPVLSALEMRRAYIKHLFSGEVDERNVPFVDLSALGCAIAGDCDVDDAKLFEAYAAGNTEGVYKWFAENFAEACDTSKPGALLPEHFTLTPIAENVARAAEPIKRRAAPKAKKQTDGEPAKPKKPRKTAADAEDQKVNGKDTITKFSNITSVPGKPPVVAVATHAYFASLSSDHEKSALEKSILEVLEGSGLDEYQNTVCPLKSTASIRSIVAPSSEAKVASNVPKKTKKNAKANGDAASTGAQAPEEETANGEEEVCIPESARSQYFAYASQIPKPSRRLMVGNELTNAENHTTPDGTKPATKLQSDVRVRDFYSRVIATARQGNHAILDPDTVRTTIEGASKNKSEFNVFLAHSTTLLMNSVLKIAYDVNVRSDFHVSEENLGLIQNNEKFAAWVANFLYLHNYLTQAKFALGKEKEWAQILEQLPDVCSKVKSVGTGWW